jgi:elongation factor P--(R)-beta-lysine ligase
MSIVRGRCVWQEGGRIEILGEAGRMSAEVGTTPVAVGSLVEIEDGRVRRVAPGQPSTVAAQILDPRRLHGMAVRERVEDGIRAFFRARGFREVRTPILVPCPGMEPHLVPFRVGDAGWLHTSPELAMKRLLVGGLERVFQMAAVFRDEPAAPTHRREFVMLEWYRAWAGLEAILEDTEELVADLARACHGGPSIPWRSGRIDVTPPWPRLAVRDLFAGVGVDLAHEDLVVACARLGVGGAPDDTWDDRFFRIWLGVLEPRLPADRAVFVIGYPPSQAALAVVAPAPDGTPWARRFEAYAGGLELGNAFEELTDPVEQRRRFEADRETRLLAHGDAGPPLPEAFLAALAQGMPPSGGIAVGVDRLAMLLAGETDIEYVRWE